MGLFDLGVCPSDEPNSLLYHVSNSRLAGVMDSPSPYPPLNPPSALDVQEGGDHYKTMKIQPVEFIHANGIPFIEGCVIKYVTRWKSKGGIKDLEKARHFIDLLIELEKRNTITPNTT